MLDGDNADDSVDDNKMEMDDDVDWTPFEINEITPKETCFPRNALPSSAHNDTSGKPRYKQPDTRSCCQVLELFFLIKFCKHFLYLQIFMK